MGTGRRKGKVTVCAVKWERPEIMEDSTGQDKNLVLDLKMKGLHGCFTSSWLQTSKAGLSSTAVIINNAL